MDPDDVTPVNFYLRDVKRFSAQRAGAPRVSFTPSFSSILSTNQIGSSAKRRGPFDDTVLNRNDSFIKRRKLKMSQNDNESDLDASIGTPWETKHMRSELIQARAEIKTLESKLSMMSAKMREDNLLHDQERETLQSALDRERQTIEDCERRIRKLKRREEVLREELNTAFESVDADRADFETRTMDLHSENNDLKSQLLQVEESKNELELKVKSHQIDTARLESQLKTATDQISLLTEQVATLRESLKEFDTVKRHLTTAQIRNKELESEIHSLNETTAVVKAQQAKLKQYSELEHQLKALASQNYKLKENSTNAMYMESVVDQLKERLRFFESVEKELLETKITLGFAEGKLEEYKTAAESVIGSGASASRLLDYIRTLQRDALVAANLQSQTQARVKSLEESNEAAATASANLTEQITELKKELEVANANFRRLKKQNDLIILERNDLRRLIDSCQKEMTLGGVIDPRADALEKLVETYRKKLQQYIDSDCDLGPELSRLRKENEALKFKIAPLEGTDTAKLAEENEALKKKIEKFEYELEHRALKGDFNTAHTKILHYNFNPTTEALNERANTLEKLQTENAQLKERLRLIQEGELVDLTQNVANIVNEDTTRELLELREKVKTQDIANQRLTEAFKTKGREFREAIYALMGYKVDALKDRLYRLSSLYADSPHHYLIFQMTDQGAMELLETEFSKNLTDLVETILIPNNSIPLFLASVTMDLYKRQGTSMMESTVQSVS